MITGFNSDEYELKLDESELELDESKLKLNEYHQHDSPEGLGLSFILKPFHA